MAKKGMKGLSAKQFHEIQIGSRDWNRFFEIMFPKKGGKS